MPIRQTSFLLLITGLVLTGCGSNAARTKDNDTALHASQAPEPEAGRVPLQELSCNADGVFSVKDDQVNAGAISDGKDSLLVTIDGTEEATERSVKLTFKLPRALAPTSIEMPWTLYPNGMFQRGERMFTNATYYMYYDTDKSASNSRLKVQITKVEDVDGGKKLTGTFQFNAALAPANPGAACAQDMAAHNDRQPPYDATICGAEKLQVSNGRFIIVIPAQ